MDVDEAGNVLFTGVFQLECDFDPGMGVFNLTPNGNNTDAFICKFDTDGALVWAKSFSGSSSTWGMSITNDMAGNIYSTGYFSGTTDFDPDTGVYNLFPLLPRI